MVSVRAVGIRTNDPQRVEVALFALRDFFAPPPQSDGYGVAAFVDDAILLTRVPGVFFGRSWADLAASLKGGTAIMQIRSTEELRPQLYQSSDANLGPFRLRHFTASVVGGPQDADEANALREKLIGDLPEFLRRSISGQTEAEALFFKIVAECHRVGGMDNKYPDAKLVVDAIAKTLESVGSKHPRMIMFATGREIVHFAHCTPSAAVVINGLSMEMAEDRSAAFMDSAIARERLRQFRAVLSLGGVKKPLKNVLVLPKGMTLKAFAESSAYVLGRDFTLQSV